MEFLLHKKFGRAIFFSYREFSLTRSSLIGSFDCTSKAPGRCPWIQWMGNSNTFKKLLKIQNSDIFKHREIFSCACKNM